MNTRLLTPTDVAELVGLSEHTVRRAIRDGELRHVLLRRRIRIHPDALADWIDTNTHGGQPAPRHRVREPAPRPTTGRRVTADNVEQIMREQRARKAS